MKDLAAHRRGCIAERPDDDVCGHDRVGARIDGGTEWSESDLVEGVHEGQREMRVNGGVAVAGKVLRASGHAGVLEPPNERAHMPRHELAVRAERPDPDHRVLRVGVDVRDRREVEVDADLGQLGPEGGGDALGELDVVHDSERPVPRIGAARTRLEPGHVAALLVDRDHEVGLLRAKVVGQSAELLPALDVPGVQHDASEAFGESTAKPVGHGRPLEAGEDAARGESLELAPSGLDGARGQAEGDLPLHEEEEDHHRDRGQR